MLNYYDILRNSVFYVIIIVINNTFYPQTMKLKTVVPSHISLGVLGLALMAIHAYIVLPVLQASVS